MIPMCHVESILERWCRLRYWSTPSRLGGGKRAKGSVLSPRTSRRGACRDHQYPVSIRVGLAGYWHSSGRNGRRCAASVGGVCQTSRMSDTSFIATRTLAWKVRHSAWLLAVALGFGSFSCIGFIYCAVRVRSTAWKRRAVVVTTLSLVGLVLLLSPVEHVQDVGGGYAAILWLVLIGYGLFVNRDYLQWRSAQEPVTPIGAPPVPVVPVATASMPVARPEDEVPTRAEVSVPIEAVPVSKRDEPQVEATPTDWPFLPSPHGSRPRHSPPGTCRSWASRTLR